MKKLFLALMGLTSLGSIQAAEKYKFLNLSYPLIGQNNHNTSELYMQMALFKANNFKNKLSMGLDHLIKTEETRRQGMIENEKMEKMMAELIANILDPEIHFFGMKAKVSTLQKTALAFQIASLTSTIYTVLTGYLKADNMAIEAKFTSSTIGFNQNGTIITNIKPNLTQTPEGFYP